jgi:hypothetical protein
MLHLNIISIQVTSVTKGQIFDKCELPIFLVDISDQQIINVPKDSIGY